MPDEIVPLLFLGNITDSTNWHGAVIPCLFDVDGFREEFGCAELVIVLSKSWMSWGEMA